MSDTLAGWDARHDACWLFFGAIVSLLFIASLTLPHPWGDIMIVGVLAFELVALPVGAVRGRELFVARSLCGLVVLLESHPDRWPDPNFRGRASRRIERAAEHIEHVPQQLQPGDSVTRAWACDLALSVSVALLVNRVPGASIISAILGSLAIGLFSKAGLTIATINQAADTVKVLSQH